KRQGAGPGRACSFRQGARTSCRNAGETQPSQLSGGFRPTAEPPGSTSSTLAQLESSSTITATSAWWTENFRSEIRFTQASGANCQRTEKGTGEPSLPKHLSTTCQTDSAGLAVT